MSFSLRNKRGSLAGPVSYTHLIQGFLEIFVRAKQRDKSWEISFPYKQKNYANFELLSNWEGEDFSPFNLFLILIISKISICSDLDKVRSSFMRDISKLSSEISLLRVILSETSSRKIQSQVQFKALESPSNCLLYTSRCV